MLDIYTIIGWLCTGVLALVILGSIGTLIAIFVMGAMRLSKPYTATIFERAEPYLELDEEHAGLLATDENEETEALFWGGEDN